MSLEDVVWKVIWRESERGWGQRIEVDYYDTKEHAQSAIDSVNEENNADWERTDVVPDWYVQPDSDEPVPVLRSTLPKNATVIK